MTIRPATPIGANASGACRPSPAANHAQYEPALPEYRLLQEDLVEEDRVARVQCAVCLLTAALVLVRVAATCLDL